MKVVHPSVSSSPLPQITANQVDQMEHHTQIFNLFAKHTEEAAYRDIQITFDQSHCREKLNTKKMKSIHI